MLIFILVLLAGEAILTPLAPPEPPNYQATAQVFRDAVDLSGEIAFWQSILESEPANPQAHYHLAMLTALTDPTVSPAHLSKAENHPDYADNVSRLKGGLQLARFAEDPAYAHILTGQALASVEAWDLAMIAFTRSTQAAPTYAEAWAYLGEAQQQSGQDGKEALETALALNPDSFAVNVFTGMYWRKQGKPEIGLLYFKTAAKLYPDNRILQVDIAATLAEMGNFEDAIAHLQQVIDSNPQDVFSWQSLASFSLDNDIQVDTIGINASRQAVILGEKDPVSLTLLGRAYAFQQDAFNTKKFLLLALEANPEYAPAHLHMGIHYLSQDKLPLALEHFDFAVQYSMDQAIKTRAQQYLDQFSP